LIAELAYASVAELGEALRSRKVSSVELTTLSLSRLEGAGRRLNAAAASMRESALEEARRADRELAEGKPRGPLHGIPYAAKDLLDTKGVATTWGSRLYADRIPASDAAVVTRLRDAGAVLVGKLAMIELAGGPGYRYASASLQGPCRNPWKTDRWTGGSSSGCGAAVAAGIVPFAIGSETWGSIMCPSSYCGLSGLRPTFGRVSRAGAMPLSWTLDKLGPMARSADDLGPILAAIAGADPSDPSTLGATPEAPAPSRSLRIGVLPAKSWDGYQPEAVARAADALAVLASKGHRLVDVTLPALPFDALTLTILYAEAAAAFDDLVRSGRHLELIDPAAKTGLLTGATIPAPEYVNATRRRTLACAAIARLFETVDVLAGPSFPSEASPLEANLEEWYALPVDPLGAPGNLCGLPAVSVPCGLGPNGLPLGVTFQGPAGGEAAVLAAARAFQLETAFHRRHPQEA